jgi:DNA-binding transcriptional ArsR family regulator
MARVAPPDKAAACHLTNALSKDTFRNMPFDTREISDAKTMRALAHPVRLALLEALADAPTLTATEAGERVGESPANASFHLRQLAKYGFVEEAEAGTGRRRPWRLKHLGLRFSDIHGDPETARAAVALDRTMRDRYLGRAERAFEESRALPEEWRRVTGMNEMRLYLTADELAELDAELTRVMLERFADRRAHRPPGTERVEILTLAYRAP